MLSEIVAITAFLYFLVAVRVFNMMWAEPRYDILATSVAVAVAWLPYSIYIALVNRG